MLAAAGKPTRRTCAEDWVKTARLDKLNVTNRSLGRRLKPADREALSQRRSELEIAVESIREALGAFQQGGTIQGLQPGQSTTLNGVTIERID